MNIDNTITLTRSQLKDLRDGLTIFVKTGTNIMGEPIYDRIRPPKKRKP